MPMAMQITREDITFGFAIIGCALGLLNYWRSWDRDRVKIKVLPKLSRFLHQNGAIVGAISSTERDYDKSRICIEVINLSSFAVTICDVGFVAKGGGKFSMFQPITYDGKDFPRKLAPRESVSFYASENPFEHVQPGTIACAYAETECDTLTTGKSKALKNYLNHLRTQSTQSSSHAKSEDTAQPGTKGE